MPKFVVLKPLRYLNRMLQVGDEIEVMPGDVKWAKARGRAEEVPDAPARRGRPPKAKEEKSPAEAPLDPTPAEAPWELGPTRSDLLARAEELGVELPAGYVGKDKLQALIAEAETSRG